MRARTACGAGALALAALGGPAAAQDEAAPAGAARLDRVEVISVSPLPGLGVPRDQVAANVQTATAADLERRPGLGLADHLGRAFGSVTLNDNQGNPFQPDLNFRGFAASPLLGTPQGLSVYLDGVRLNQPFGDVVSWDLVPRTAIASIALMPGSNPLFGLNTLGGAIAIQTKDGSNFPGSSVQVTAGSNRRFSVEFETGGSRVEGPDWYVTGQRFHEQGWRAASPSSLGQLFGKWHQRVGATGVSLALALADDALTGNGLQTREGLQRDPRSIYTAPDQTRNRSAFLNLQAVHTASDRLTWTVHGYYRRIETDTVNGDFNDIALAHPVYQPTAAEQATLTGAGLVGFPAAGADVSNTPFPRWRCIADALQDSTPEQTCTGLLNRTRTRQNQAGAGLQAALGARAGGMDHQVLVGAAYDASQVRFSQRTGFGYVGPDRSVTPVSGPGAFADGSQTSADAFDGRVELSSRSHTGSLFASDTIGLTAGTHLTLAARYNRNVVRSIDGLHPGGGLGSLDGEQVFAHLNPAIGLTVAPGPGWTVYAGINQGARAPSAVELGCADPAAPCKLPNAFAGDPALRQVVTTTVETGVRGRVAGLAWNLGVFRSDNRDDLLFVADTASGYGYFRNFGKTRRQGLELGLAGRPAADWTVAANVTLLDATYRSVEVVGASGNSSNDAAAAGVPGVDGNITIRPGDRIPLLPRQVAKLSVEREVGPRWTLGVELNAFGGATARGNENGQHRQGGAFYSGPGRSAGYALTNLDLAWRPSRRVRLFVQVANLFDRRYATAAQLAANGFDASGRVAAQQFPATAMGAVPISRATFLAPGAPRSVGAGLRYDWAD